MRTTLHRQTNHRLIQRRTCTSSIGAGCWERPALTDTALPPLKLSRILVPLDFSQASLKTLQYAARLARQFGASLGLVHVVEKTSLASDLSNPPGGRFREDLAGIGLRILTDLRHREIGPDFPGETLVRIGEPARAIAQAAQELGIDLIVMSTPGWPGLRHVLFGPVAERVAWAAPCPVLTLNEKLFSKGAPAVAGLSACAWKHIVVPVDFSDRSRQAVRYAAALAAQVKAQLTLANVIEMGVADPRLAQARGRQIERGRWAERGLKAWAEDEIPWAISVNTGVWTGWSSDNILEQECKRLNADLIVLGVRGGRGLKHFLRADSAELIMRHAPCPVLSLHPHPKAYLRSRLAAVRRWAGDWSYRVATNRYVFYGSLILLASLIAGAVSREHEVLWRSAAALGIATVVIGFLHAWLDARSARRNWCAHTKSRMRTERFRGS